MTRNTQRSKARRWALIGIVGFVLTVAALAAAWRWTALGQALAEPRAIADWLNSMANTLWMPPVVAGVYIAASLVMFPNTVLCLAIIMALGPLEGAAYAYGGSMAAALAGYAMGRRGGKHVDKLRFRNFDRISAELRHGGFFKVLTLRLLPICPFSATNILSGVARVRVLAFLAATVIGISPYILTFAAFGRQVRRLLSDPSPTDIAVAVAIAALAAFAAWQARALAVARAK
jgi:phospholipase D1/2